VPAWSLRANLRGPAGEPGAPGEPGPPGEPGAGGAAFADTFLDTAQSSAYTIGGTSFQPLLFPEVVDAGNRYDPATGVYAVPSTGLYLCLARLRIPDNLGPVHFGMGVHTANADGPWFQWQTSPGNRYTANYQRLARFNTGDGLRLFAYYATGPNSPSFIAGALNIVRVA
jgi:hypothetical protein